MSNTAQTPHLIVTTSRQTLDVVLDRAELTLGRDASSDIVVDDPSITLLHALVKRTPSGYEIVDASSGNGFTFQGARVSHKLLADGDVLHIAPNVSLTYRADGVPAQRVAREMRLDALHLKQFVDKKRNLLQDISLSILPREFVAIVGVSGAGKSTLLNALSGFRPASEGAVLVNADDLYRNYGAYHNEIGYVPQEDIIHKELTIYEAMDYAARLRLAADMPAAERQQRIMQVLENLDLAEHKDARIDRLSGGMRKRVSIGVELLTRPGLFFLDEATSGLDPGSESQLMQLLRKLAEQGHTILLITHATKNVMLCDQVAFLAKGGYLAFYGPPHDALSYFGVTDFDEIYTKLENELTPAEWAERYRQSPAHQTYIMTRLQEKYGTLDATASPRPRFQIGRGTTASWGTGKTNIKRASALRQLIILSERNLKILTRDRASFWLMFLTPLFIGAINFPTWKKGIFLSQGGDATQGLIDLYLIALNAVFIGSISIMREIVKEADVYRRERMVVLKIAPYVLSKIWVGVLLALYAGAVFVAVARLASDWPDTFELMLLVYITLVLTLIAGMLLGLLISAASPNQNVTPLLLIIVIIPQLLFAGGLLPISTFGPSGQIMNALTITKWSFESLVTISGLGHDVAGDACWALPAKRRDNLPEIVKLPRCNCMGPNVFHKCNFPGIIDYYDPAIDESEPQQPAKPSEPPAPPARPTAPASPSPEAQQKFQQDLQQYERAITQYQKDTEDYLKAIKKYGDELEDWRLSFQEWKEARDRAVGQAEGLIKKIYDDFNRMFNVNLAFHWGMLLLNMAILLGLILIAQKRKDVI